MENFRKTNIIGTLGPASEDKIEELLKKGMNVARINFSHGDGKDNYSKVEKFKQAREKLGISAAIMLDTQGLEIRTGKLQKGFEDGVYLEKGYEFKLLNNGEPTTDKQASVSYPELYKDVKPGDIILMDDGSLSFKVKEIKGQEIITIVKQGGILKSKKSVNIPGVYLNNPALKEKDINDLKFGAKEQFEFVAASFVRNKDDLLAIRKVLDENGGQDIEIISKIENRQALEHLDEIIDLSDGVMIARGDLAVEIPYEEVPVYQKELIHRCNEAGKPVIVATQMLESMISNPAPTRAEASDVANAVYDRASSVMLSGECAVGKYPVQCVETMANIAKSVESKIRYWQRIKFDTKVLPENIEEQGVILAVSAAKELEADYILAYTNTGKSVKKIAGYGPKCPIIAVTDNLRTYNKLSLVWNVFPIYMEKHDVIQTMLEKAIEDLKENKTLKKGDKIVITGGKDYIQGVSESKRIGGIAII